MGIRIVFGVMSATQSPAAVDQLARLLAPHRVVVHHDFAKRADFVLTAPNAEIIPDPRDTGWGTWGFSDAIFHTVKYALDHHEFDYFQLLSPTCLPIRPLAEFERFVATDPAQAHIDRIPVDGTDDALMTFGYRTFAPGNTLRFRVLRRVRAWYFGNEAELVQTESLSMLRRARGGTTPVGPRERFARTLTRFAAGGGLGRHPFGPKLRAMIGGVFFGARRHVCDALVRYRDDAHLLSYVRDLQIVDETLFPTLLCNAGFAVGPSNHAINDFTREGSPRWIEVSDLDRLYATGRFFARKFTDDPDAATRLRTIARVTTATARTAEAGSSSMSAAAGRERGLPRVLFAVMSSQQPAETVSQLVDALAPHPVLVHHDTSKRADFGLARPNASLVPDPLFTGWGTAGFADAIFHTVRHALAHHDFDYLQLLSPTCLPIRPLDDYLAHLRDSPADIHADMMRVERDDDVLMTFAYRTFVPGGTLRFRALRRARSLYFGRDAELVQTHSLSILRPRPRPGVGDAPLARRTGLALTRLAARGALAPNPYGATFRPMIGSVWFGARRTACEHVMRLRQDARTIEFFNALHIVDETIVASTLAATGFEIGPSNHSISAFNDRGNPRWIDVPDLDAMFASGRFFGRKFPEDPASPVRALALERLRAEALAA